MRILKIIFSAIIDGLAISSLMVTACAVQEVKKNTFKDGCEIKMIDDKAIPNGKCVGQYEVKEN